MKTRTRNNKRSRNKLKIVVILGTRPEIIKLSPLIFQLERQFICKTVFTGQHTSNDMVEQIRADLKLRPFDYMLAPPDPNRPVGQLCHMLKETEEVLLKERPDLVIVQGDTNSTLAGALCADKLGIKVVHIEAGARCFDKGEPEENNRIIVDHIASLNFAFSRESLLNLRKEGLKHNSFIFPNTVYETCHLQRPHLSRSRLLNQLGPSPETYLLVTFHRASNTLNPTVLRKLCSLVSYLSGHYPIVLPLHPRTRQRMEQWRIALAPAVKTTPPLGYLDFLHLLSRSKAVISDSGGVVDEALSFNRPLFILRPSTERTDVLRTGKAHLVSPQCGQTQLRRTLLAHLQDKNLERMRKKKFPIDPDISSKMVGIIRKFLIDIGKKSQKARTKS